MMMHPRTIKILQSSMIFLCLIFIALFIIEYRNSYSLEEEVVSRVDANEGSDQNSVNNRIPDAEDFNTIIERPLFSVTRRPVENNNGLNASSITPEIVNTRNTSNEEFLLSGIMITENEKFAFVLSDSGRTTSKLRIGEEISDWTLTEIESHAVTISRGSEQKVLELEVRKSPVRVDTRQVQTRAKANVPAVNAKDGTSDADVDPQLLNDKLDKQKAAALSGINDEAVLPERIRSAFVPPVGQRTRPLPIMQPRKIITKMAYFSEFIHIFP
jgi:type II secretory pathway component PulC